MTHIISSNPKGSRRKKLFFQLIPVFDEIKMKRVIMKALWRECRRIHGYIDRLLMKRN